MSPPLAILDHAQVLREMMIVYESSLLGNEDEEELQAGFRDILDKMVDPALELTLTQADEKKRQRPAWDKAVFVLNTLAYLQSVLEPYAFTTEKQGVVQGLVDAKVLQLIEEHVSTSPWASMAQQGSPAKHSNQSVPRRAQGCRARRGSGSVRGPPPQRKCLRGIPHKSVRTDGTLSRSTRNPCRMYQRPSRQRCKGRCTDSQSG